MACKPVCQLCDKLVISQSVTFADNVLTINLPAGSYLNGNKYCIVIAQTIPEAATINAPVVITLGATATTYPLTGRNCAQLTAAALRTRTRYATIAATNAAGGGAFRLLGRACCAPDNRAAALVGEAATAAS